MVEETLGRADPPATADSVSGFKGVRFRRLVQGGGRFTVKLAPASKGRSFKVTIEDEPCCTGTVLTSDPLKPAEPVEPVAGDAICAIEELVPHRPPMLLVDRLVESDGNRCVSETQTGPEWPLTKDNAASSIVLVEVVAQTAAALMGLEARTGAGTGPGDAGFLVGVRSARWSSPFVPTGAFLTTSVERIAFREGYSIFKGAVLSDAGVTAEVRLQAMQALALMSR